MNNTASISVKEKTKKLLKKYFGYDSFRPLQFEVIEKVINKKDVVLLMPTGGGKSICYQLPALYFEGTAIVVSPLIALMKDQVQGLKANGVEAEFINSSLSWEEEKKIKDNVIKGKIKLLYVSPEKLLTRSFYDLIKSINISLFAIDEAHCISQWGHDFRPEYTKLEVLKKNFPEVPIIALTATADKLTRDDIANNLKLNEAEKFISSFDRPNLSLEVRPGQKKFEQIAKFIAERPNTSGIVYCLSKKSTEHVAQKLKKMGIKAAHYHAGMDSSSRSKTQDNFINDKIDVICATIAFGMGIDKSNVRWIIHHNLPKNIESFYQEIGRAGRDGLPAETLLFYSFQDVMTYRRFFTESGRQEIENTKLNRMLDYAEGVSCRRRTLLSYFGEFPEEDCGNCDVCANPPKSFDGTIIAQKAFSGISRLKGKVGMNMLINVLRGSQARDIFMNNYHQIKTYGAGADISFQAWQQYVLQLLNQGYIEIAYDKGNTLQLTEASKDVLFDNKKVQLVNFTFYKQEKEKKEVAKKLTVTEKLHIELFNLLTEKRKELADKEGIAPHLIFNDVALREMIEKLPIDSADLKEIQGMSIEKMKKYGLEFINVIGNFLEDKLSQKQNLKGSTYKLSYFLYHIKKQNIEEIAENRKLGAITIVGHLAKMYEEGKNIDIYQFISDKEIEKVEQAIRESEDEEPSLKQIYFALNEELNYEKIKWAMAYISKTKVS